MKHYLYTLMTVIILTVAFTESATAKRVVVPNMYLFGFAASFNDTIVYFTDIQQVDSAWIDKRTKFLQSRDIYSSQLRDFLATEKKMPQRTCVVFYDKKKQKLEKKLMKMQKLYGKGKDGREHFDVRHLAIGDFHFKSTDLTELEATEQEQATDNSKTKKLKKKEAKKLKKEKRKEKKRRGE